MEIFAGIILQAKSSDPNRTNPFSALWNVKKIRWRNLFECIHRNAIMKAAKQIWVSLSIWKVFDIC